MRPFFLKSKNSFEGKLSEEKVILITRRHPLFLFLPGLATFILFSFPFLIYFFLQGFSWYQAVSSLFWPVSMIYFLIIWILCFRMIMIYLLSSFILTTKRVIKIETKGFFKHERAEAPLEKIQDIEVKISGLLATFFNFGDIEIQTAGTARKFILTYLPNPQEIKKRVFKEI